MGVKKAIAVPRLVTAETAGLDDASQSHEKKRVGQLRLMCHLGAILTRRGIAECRAAVLGLTACGCFLSLPQSAWRLASPRRWRGAPGTIDFPQTLQIGLGLLATRGGSTESGEGPPTAPSLAS